MTLATYAHVFDELDAGERLPAEEQITRARAEHVPVSYLSEPGPQEADWKTPADDGWAVPGSNRGPPACKGAQDANERAREDTREHEDPANQLEEQMRLWSDEEPG